MSAAEVEETPALFEHCTRVYKALAAASKESDMGLVFTGSVTALFEELGLGIPYYTPVMRKLKAMDCVRQIERGGGTKPSKWLLLQEPTMELFKLPAPHQTRYSQSRGAKLMMEQQLRDLGRRVSSLEAWARNNGWRG